MQASVGGSIRVGGAVRNIQPGESLTAGELAALNQVISSGRQVLALNALGAAISGNINLVSDIGRDASSLVIPRGVFALGDFSKIAGLNFSGNLVNSGTLLGYSTSMATTAANISAANIFNNRGALLSTVLPAGSLALTSAIATLDLNLHATHEIVNAGTIASSGALSLTAGHQILNALSPGVFGESPIIQANNSINLNTSLLTNRGLIQSVNSNINILAKASEDLAVLAAGGRFAAAGNINVGDSTSQAKFDTKLFGGDWHANELNIHSGDGHATANLNDVFAVVNVYAGGAHLYANTDNLRIGDFALTGDPTISNTGDLNLAGSISTGGGPLALVAGGNIDAGTATTISTANLTGGGGNIIIVAGADFTLNGNDLDINGGSAAGGNVSLGALDSISSVGGDGTTAANGGNIQIVAFGGPSTGIVDLPNVFTNGSNVGTNGNVEVIAGNSDGGTSITTGVIDTTGGTGGGGNVALYTATPTLPDGKLTIDNTPVTGGAVTFGSITPGGLQAASISATGKISGNDLIVQSALGPLTLTTSVSTLSAIAGGTITVNEDDGISLLEVYANSLIVNAGLSASGNIGTGANLALVDDLTLNNALGGIDINHNLSAANVTFESNGSINQSGTTRITATDLNASTTDANVNIRTDIGNLLVLDAGSGDIVVDDLGTLAITADGHNISITAPSIDIVDHITATGELLLLTPNFLPNSGDSITITADTVNITSPSTLNIGSNPAFVAGTTSLIAGGTGGNIIFGGSGDITFTGAVNAYAPNAGSINVGNATILSADTVSLYTPNISGIDSIGGISVVQVNENGTGTIANKDGDVVLPARFEYVGKDLAILAAGNVIASPASSSIKLSNPQGSAGSLTIIAGYDFTTTGSIILPGFNEVPFSDPKAGLVTISGPSASGGSVLMPKTSITANSTFAGTPSSGSYAGGTVTVVAHAGTENAGLISLDDISTTSRRGVGGPVTLIGEGGVSTGSITTKGISGGKVTISGSTPEIIGGAFVINNGVVTGTGRFAGTAPSETNGAAIFVNGSIDTTGSTVRGGDVNLAADGQVEVRGGITARGVSAPNYLTTAGGKAAINSLSKVLIGGAGINTSALASNSASSAGDAGAITISAGSQITSGKLIAHGGDNKGAGGGGAGGDVSLKTTETVMVSTVPYNVGAIRINGFIDCRGGSASRTADGAGGNGGGVTLTAGTVSVNGAVSGASIIASGGAQGGTGAAGTGGTVSIDTFSIQPLPNSLDLISKTKNIVKLPGGMFSFGQANPINGVSAKIVTGDIVLDKINTAGQVGAPGISVGSIDIDVSGPDPLLNGKRVLLTPSQAIVQYQADRGQVVNPLIVNVAGQAQSGEITIDQSELNSVIFTGFKIPNQNITLHITGTRPILNLPASIVMSGTLDFSSPGATSYINLGAGNFTVNPGAQVLSDNTSKLILSGTGATYTNKGTIIAGDLIFARPTTAGLTFIGADGSNTQVNRILLGPAMDVGMRFSFKSQGADNFDVPVEFAAVPLPLSYKSDALSLSKNANLVRTVGLNFSLGEMSGAALVPSVAEVGGTLTGRLVGEVTVKGLKTTVPGFSPVLTSVTLAEDTDIAASKSLTISSVDNVQIADNVDLKAGLFTRNPPIGAILPKDIKSPGAINIFADGNAGVEIGSDGSITSIRNNLTIRADNGNVSIGANNDFTVWGGNLSVLAEGTVSGSDNNEFTAKGMYNTANGAIQISSGSTTSKIGSAFTQKRGTQPDPITLLGPVNYSSFGVVLLKTSGGGSVNLGTSALSSGVLIFEAAGDESSVTFGAGNKFSSSSDKPIAFVSPVAPHGKVFTFNGEEQIDTTAGARVAGVAGAQITVNDEGIKLFDGEIFVEATAPTSIETAHGLVEVKKGALVHIDMRNGNAHVKACGNAGDVTVYGYNHKFPLAPGQEVILTSHEPSQKDMLPADGVGRRNQQTKKLKDGGHVIMSDVSLLTVISSQSALKNKPENKRAVEKVLKTAAALDVITKARGGYVATPREAVKRHNNVEAPAYAASGNHLSPVSYRAN